IIFIILYALFQRPAQTSAYRFIFFLVTFCFAMLLITGYIVPNSGSIVRYRSLYLTCLVIPFLMRVPKRIKI
ncbi:MAG: hypothetical protein ABIY51_13395, partial [Ferruginibacter sp.]